MPMVAYFEERSPAADRRRTVRRALRLGVVTGDDAELATIHDLSLTGALIETSVPMLVGATFEVDMPNVGAIAANPEIEELVDRIEAEQSEQLNSPEDLPSADSIARDFQQFLRQQGEQ